MITKVIVFTLLSIPLSLHGQALKPTISFTQEAPLPPANYDPDVSPQHNIVLMVNGQRAGFINYCTYHSNPHIVGLYNLYVYPPYRAHGYARQLLQHVIKELGKKGFQKILVLPGPFEYRDGKTINLEGVELEQAMKKLVRLYQTTGFTFDPNNPENMVYAIPKSPGYAPFLIVVFVAIVIVCILLR